MSASSARGTARVAAQAKLNLLLRVLSREPSGYHQLVTLFQRIALADTITVRTAVSGRSLVTAGADVGPTGGNLAWRAATAFARAAAWPASFAIEIQKRIPVGGGLGGGSADAAAVLRALNALAPERLGDDDLLRIARSLGSDIPFLLSDSALALGTGRGEQLLALDPLPEREIVLVLPQFGVSSGEAFGWHAAARAAGGSVNPPTPILPSPLTWKVVAAYAANDLEHAVFTRHPSLAKCRSTLEAAGASIARMTGSGSTIFGVIEPPTSADAVTHAIAPGTLDVQMIVTSTVAHPASVELL